MRRNLSRHHTLPATLPAATLPAATLRAATVAGAMLAAASLAPALACAPAAGQDPAPPPMDRQESVLDVLTSGAVALIDLTYPLSPDSIYWPTGDPFVHEYSGEISAGGYWYASGSFSSPEHLGTHLDAPIHFGEAGWTSAEIPLRRLIAPGIVIDISDRAAHDADAVLVRDDIAAWERRNGAVPAGSIVVVRTAWAPRWPDWNAYYGTETPRNVATLHFPGVSREAAQLLSERGIYGLGIDTASVDPGISSSFEAHQVLAAANVFNLENLTNVEGLPETGFAIIALPMKIEQGTGGPARVVAVVTQ